MLHLTSPRQPVSGSVRLAIRPLVPHGWVDTEKASRIYGRLSHNLLVKNLFGFDDFAILVEAAVRANAMRKLDLSALRANAASRRIDAVMGAATSVGANTTHALFRYCHLYSPSICASYRVRRHSL